MSTRIAKTAAFLMMAAAAWQTALLARDLVVYRHSSTVWLALQTRLPVYLLVGFGGVALVLGKRSGYRVIYVSALLAIPNQVPEYHPVRWITHASAGDLVSDRLWRAFPTGVFEAYLALVVVLAITHLVRGRSAQAVRPWWQFRVRSLFGLTGFVAVLLSAPLNADRLVSAGWKALDRGAPSVVDVDPEFFVQRNEDVILRYPFTPAWTDAHFRLSGIYQGRGEYERAISVLTKTLEADAPVASAFNSSDDRFMVYAGLTRCYERLERCRNALEYATLALKEWERIGPHMTYVHKAIRGGWTDLVAELQQHVCDHRSHQPDAYEVLVEPILTEH